MPDNVHFMFHTKAIKHFKKLSVADREKTFGLIKAKVYGFLYHNDRRYLTQTITSQKWGCLNQPYVGIISESLFLIA